MASMMKGRYIWKTAIEGCRMEAAVRLDNYEGPVQPEDREIPNPLVIRPVSGFGGTKESFIADLQDCVQCSIHNFWDEIQSNTRKINLCARFGHHYIYGEMQNVSTLEQLNTSGRKVQRTFCPGGTARSVNLASVIKYLCDGGTKLSQNVKYVTRVGCNVIHFKKVDERNTEIESCFPVRAKKFMNYTLQRAQGKNLDLRFQVRSTPTTGQPPATDLFVTPKGIRIQSHGCQKPEYVHKETNIVIEKEGMKFTILDISEMKLDEGSGLWKPEDEKDEVSLKLDVEADSQQEMVDAAKRAVRGLFDICCKLDPTLFN